MKTIRNWSTGQLQEKFKESLGLCDAALKADAIFDQIRAYLHEWAIYEFTDALTELVPPATTVDQEPEITEQRVVIDEICRRLQEAEDDMAIAIDNRRNPVRIVDPKATFPIKAANIKLGSHHATTILALLSGGVAMYINDIRLRSVQVGTGPRLLQVRTGKLSNSERTFPLTDIGLIDGLRYIERTNIPSPSKAPPASPPPAKLPTHVDRRTPCPPASAKRSATTHLLVPELVVGTAVPVAKETEDLVKLDENTRVFLMDCVSRVYPGLRFEFRNTW